jgi:hypothetical protein
MFDVNFPSLGSNYKYYIKKNILNCKIYIKKILTKLILKIIQEIIYR